MPLHPIACLGTLSLLLGGACGHGVSSSGRAAAAAPSPSAEVKVGRCTGINGLVETKAAGFDYAELPVREIMRLSDAELEQALARHKEVGLPTPTANVFLPSDMKVVGPGIDQAPVVAYASRAFDRMARFGVKVVVFGSGGARKVPEGFSRDEAFAQLVDFARKIAPQAQSRGITLVVEPLRRQETNIINTAAEGLAWVKAVGHPSFQLMVDFYHLATEKEDPSIIVEARDHIRHFHIANPNRRVFPMDAGEYDYSAFFAAVKKSGYRGTMSVEGGTRDFAADGPRAVAFLRASLGNGSPPVAAAAAR
jgi:D-psicose/D-tagatose/L-ribulose 3-epimerase